MVLATIQRGHCARGIVEDGETTSVGNGHQTTPEAFAPGDSRPTRPLMTLGATIALIAWTVLSDWLIYRSYGYAGPAAFFALAPWCFLFGQREPTSEHSSLWTRLICVALLAAVVGRLAVLGNAWVFTSGVLITFAFALACSRTYPWALETVALFVRAPLDGMVWFCTHRLPSVAVGEHVQVRRAGLANWLLPLVVTSVFAGIFVLANPDLVRWVSERIDVSIDWIWEWAGRLSPWEVPFCILSLVIGAGLLYPVYGKRRIGGEDQSDFGVATHETPIYFAIRNTLLCLVMLFSAYLAFEFWTLWKREFPADFYYAGYAHQGAAWLTIALALATGLLSLIFHGRTLKDPRIGTLKRLAWVWSALNFLLAVAVFNRLSIYVGYNGLTPMRIVGYFGITAVVAGFALVVVKVAQNRGFWWLMRTQLTALMLVVILFILFPVDFVAHTYNASRIKAGYLHPSVMIAVKPMDDLGYLSIIDLIDCEDPIIRDGVRAMLASRQLSIEIENRDRRWHWTRFQASTARLYKAMADRESNWSDVWSNARLRRLSIERFKNYSMQWY